MISSKYWAMCGVRGGKSKGIESVSVGVHFRFNETAVRIASVGGFERPEWRVAITELWVQCGIGSKLLCLFAHAHVSVIK